LEAYSTAGLIFNIALQSCLWTWLTQLFRFRP